MFKEALELRASDIHIEPMGGMLRVRYRIDGVLRGVAEHPPHLAAPLISRLKIMGSMDIAEKRKPRIAPGWRHVVSRSTSCTAVGRGAAG